MWGLIYSTSPMKQELGSDAEKDVVGEVEALCNKGQGSYKGVSHF